MAWTPVLFDAGLVLHRRMVGASTRICIWSHHGWPWIERGHSSCGVKMAAPFLRLPDDLARLRTQLRCLKLPRVVLL